ncbi:MAG TPA: Mur ligase family protein [Pyrinomonadaceae bacterium]
MNFDESVSYLFGLGHETLAIKLGLENVARLLGRLGRPQDSFPSVQIAGTNGKGSTAAMLDAVCRAAGLRTGLYTSPHLVSVTERVRIGGREIARDEFARHATRVRAAAEDVERESGALPTFFEQVTAAALCAFAEAGVELAILETGLGGRLDATTAAGARWVAVTQVALDHQEYLGTTLAEIAAEKAAIIRPGVRSVVVAAPQEPEALAVILARCREFGLAPRMATDEINVEEAGADGRLRVNVRTARAEYAGVRLALRGRHQLANAATAVALAEALAEDGFKVSREHVVEGLETAEHAGRLELRTYGGHRLLFDGAHNAAGALALRAYLDEFAGGPVTMVFGAMRDKQLGEIGRALFPAARHLVLTEPRSPRAATVQELLRAVPVPPSSSTIALAPSSRDALAVARTHTEAGGLVCVTGSLYLVGEIKSLLAEGGG